MGELACPVLIGRDDELRVLEQATVAAMAGEGRCAILIGEPGIGKSRLAREIANRAARQGARVAMGRAVPSSASTAYGPITELLLQLLRSDPLPDDPTLAPWLPLLQPLVPTLTEPQAATPEVSPTLRAEAVVQLLGRVAGTGIVAILEDLHWADSDTVAVLEYLADNLASMPLLLLVTLRDTPASSGREAALRLRNRPAVSYVALARLNDDQLAAMVRACVPDADDRLVERIQATAEGIPLLVEDLLASPGLPVDFTTAVAARLALLSGPEREVIEAAAVLGRQFEWELLPAITGHNDASVTDALAAGVASMLLENQGSTIRFRHALTREAVLHELLPPRQRDLAAAALRAMTLAGPVLGADRRAVAIDLALRAGDRGCAGQLLVESGQEALGRGALATAVDTLERATELLAGTADQTRAEVELAAALAQAGRVDEAAAVGARMVIRLGADPRSSATLVEVHLQVAHAAIATSRWSMVRHHLDEAERLAAADGPPSARLSVLRADLAMAEDDYESARTLANRALVAPDASPDVQCHALEVIGRSQRLSDLAAAGVAFERALVTAQSAGLPHWRLRALHELGTIDLFDHAGFERLVQAHQTARETGALVTMAVLDLQLSAAFTCRWDLEGCDAHARSAIDIARQLGLDQVGAKALAMLCGSASMRADLARTEEYAASAMSALPDDRMLEGLCLASQGLAVLLAGDVDRAIEPWSRGIRVLSRLPHAEPAAVRALWPLLLAVRGDRQARSALEEARRLGVAAFRLNRAVLVYGDAVLAGRQGDRKRAQDLVAVADRSWINCDGWADLVRLLAAPAAASDGWADPRPWLERARAGFAQRGLPQLVRRCEELLGAAVPNPWSAIGVTRREAEVLSLVGHGLRNKDIAARLQVSPRTVEKHVESILRKVGARSRVELVSLVATGTPGHPEEPPTGT